MARHHRQRAAAPDVTSSAAVALGFALFTLAAFAASHLLSL